MRASEDKTRYVHNSLTPKHHSDVNFENYGRPKNFSFSCRSKQNSIQKSIMEESRTNHNINNCSDINGNQGDNSKDKIGLL